MTLLEYVITNYLGPPTYCRGDGQSEWLCPMCTSSKFHTLPDKPEFRHRFRCWSCGFRGDIHDWLVEQHPEENYGDRLARIDQLRREWQEKGDREPRALHSRGFLGSTKAYDREPMQDEFSDDADAAVADLRAYDLDTDVLKAQVEALTICGKYGLNPAGLARRIGFIAWVEEKEHEHMAGCKDPKCKYACCRVARGLKPLTSRSVKETDSKSAGANSNKPAHEPTSGNSDKTARKRTGKR